MTTQEANRIIAEFMGVTNCGNECLAPCDCIANRKPSLDNLVPVWAKLRRVNFFFRWDKDEWEFVLTEINKLSSYDYEGIRELGTIQEAAAIATAKTIKEIEEEE